MTAQVQEPTRIPAPKGTARRPEMPAVRPPMDGVVRRLGTTDQILLGKLITDPITYVDDPSFHEPATETTLFGGRGRLVRPGATRFAEPAPPRCTESSGTRVPTLSHEQERLLFLRFNYARWRAARILRDFAGKRLSADATRRLLAWGHRVLDARSTIVRLNMPLVLAMAKRTRLHNIDFNELISEGNMALLRSVEKFDCARGFKFSTYSCRAILKSFSRVAMRASRYRGYFPTEFDATMERSDYVDHKRACVEEDCVDELKEILIDNLAELSDVERTVIAARFAIGAHPDQRRPKTLEQVGNVIGVTKERVRQIQNKALRKIRLALEERYLAA